MLERSFSHAGIPLLAMAPDAQARPAVLFYHGLHSHKETHRIELRSLAERGFLALGIDAVGHGQRSLSNLGSFLKQGPLLEQVGKLLRPTLAEIPLILDFLASEGYGPFGLVGISFGAMLAYASPAQDSRLRSLVAILGDPSWCLANLPDSIYAQSSLLAWNGGRDIHVPPKPAREWIATLKQRHPQGRFHYQEFPESDHFMRPEDWYDGWQKTLAWLEQDLL